MALLKNRKFAFPVCIVLMLAVLLIAVHVSGGRAAKKVETLFYEGTNSAGSTNTVAIDDQLTVRADAATGLITVAANYPLLSDDAQALREAKNALLDAKTIPEKYNANEALTAAAETLIAHAASAGLSDRDREGFDGYVQRLQGAQGVIDQNTYNEKVVEFNNGVLNKFPLSILKGITGVKAPAFFGVLREELAR